MKEEFKIVSYDLTKHGQQIQEYLFNNTDDILKTSMTGPISEKSASYWYPNIVILDGEKVAGLLFGDLSTTNSNIRELLIFKDYRKKGLSKILINHFIKHIKINNCKLVYLTCFKSNIDSIKYYKHIGFEQTGNIKYNTFVNNKWEEGIILTKHI